ncbi:MAG: methyltransferase domain-containing protein [Pseudomonadota bacterium]
MNALYDKIGVGYADHRNPDPRIAALIDEALGDAYSVLNVGSGAGAYEPAHRQVIAVDPSVAMLGQRKADAAPACRGAAESLPFADGAFDAATAILTLHHWRDQAAGLREMRRVARSRTVILTFDPDAPYFWLADYIPQIIEVDDAIMPSYEAIAAILGAISVSAVAVSHDCTDGFLGAYWRRQSAYLDAGLRGAISTFAKIGDVSDALSRLADDLATGAWAECYGHLLTQDSFDVGYRLVIAEFD